MVVYYENIGIMDYDYNVQYQLFNDDCKCFQEFIEMCKNIKYCYYFIDYEINLMIFGVICG